MLFCSNTRCRRKIAVKLLAMPPQVIAFGELGGIFRPTTIVQVFALKTQVFVSCQFIVLDSRLVLAESLPHQCVTQFFDREELLIAQYHTLHSAPDNTFHIRTAFSIELF